MATMTTGDRRRTQRQRRRTGRQRRRTGRPRREVEGDRRRAEGGRRWRAVTASVAALALVGFTVGGALARAGTQERQFPPENYLRKILTAYGVANEHPELLEGIPCYCPCELYGHGGLVDCYRSQHAAMCSVCLDEAVAAGQLFEQPGAEPRVVQQQVKSRWRNGVTSNILRDLPMAQTPGARAYAQVCSDCHQPPSPAMHTPSDWGPSLERMAGYARQSGRMPSGELWDAASRYVRSVSGQYPASAVQQVRDDLANTVERLKSDEGDSAYYPSVRDGLVPVAVFERVMAAYRAARELPAELLESTPAPGPSCEQTGHTTLLGCLNSWHGIVTEETVAEVERLAER